MKIRLGVLRRILREATSGSVATPVSSLRSGDVVAFPGSDKTFTIHKITKPKKEKVKWIICQRVNELYVQPIYSHHVAHVQQELDTGRWKGNDIIGLYDGVLVEFNINVENNWTINLLYATGPGANHVNATLRQEYLKNARESWIEGYTELDVIDRDENAAERARPLVPRGTSFQELVILAFGNEPGKPLSENEIRRRIARLRGKQYTNRSQGNLGFGPFSISAHDSLVKSGLLDRHGRGKDVTYTLRGVDKPDWRPAETVPEDYYAL